jgi:hypothetical protein
MIAAVRYFQFSHELLTLALERARLSLFAPGKLCACVSAPIVGVNVHQRESGGLWLALAGLSY